MRVIKYAKTYNTLNIETDEYFIAIAKNNVKVIKYKSRYNKEVKESRDKELTENSLFKHVENYIESGSFKELKLVARTLIQYLYPETKTQAKNNEAILEILK